MKVRAVTTLVITVLTALAGGVQAAPYLPASGSEVIETLRAGRTPQQQEQRELRRLRTALAATPRDTALAVTVAQRYISLGRRDADPRYYGYAQAALAPWWTMAAPPPEVRLLRATLLQSTHHFDPALADLAALVKLQPSNVQAWLTQATVQVVRADYAGARTSCAKLVMLAPPLVAATCAANVGSMTGQLAKSRAMLETVLSREASVDPGVNAWVHTMLAEMAERAGDDAGAQRWFDAALLDDPGDTYLIGAWTDFLLERGRAAEAAKLLAPHQAVDGLLLRYGIALKKLDRRTELAHVSAELGARFAAAMQRGDGLHQREQALYELRLRGDAPRALALAAQNWAVQKESADARLLLEAAAADGKRDAARPVLDWMRSSGVEDRRLRELARPLEKI